MLGHAPMPLLLVLRESFLDPNAISGIANSLFSIVRRYSRLLDKKLLSSGVVDDPLMARALSGSASTAFNRAA
jgi:hypothetical protein